MRILRKDISRDGLSETVFKLLFSSLSLKLFDTPMKKLINAFFQNFIYLNFKQINLDPTHNKKNIRNKYLMLIVIILK